MAALENEGSRPAQSCRWHRQVPQERWDSAPPCSEAPSWEDPLVSAPHQHTRVPSCFCGDPPTKNALLPPFGLSPTSSLLAPPHPGLLEPSQTAGSSFSFSGVQFRPLPPHLLFCWEDREERREVGADSLCCQAQIQRGVQPPGEQAVASLGLPGHEGQGGIGPLCPRQLLLD